MRSYGAGDSDAGVSLPQRRRVVDAVTGHADEMAGFLEQLDQPDLVFRKDAGVDATIESPSTVDVAEGIGRRRQLF